MNAVVAVPYPLLGTLAVAASATVADNTFAAPQLSVRYKCIAQYGAVCSSATASSPVRKLRDNENCIRPNKVLGS